MLTASSHESPKLKAYAPSGRAQSKLEPAARIQANPLWHQLATRVQRKLTVGAPNDPLEHEADRVADQVMRMPDPAAPTEPGALPATRSHTPKLRRTCAACEDEEKELQAKPTGAPGNTFAGGAEAPSLVHDVLRSPGQPLDPAARAFFEPRFGHDFSQVRVHTDAAAGQSARDVSANAYTVGHDIVFGTGRFALGTHDGHRMIAHELTHVVQQRSTAGIGVQRQSDPMDAGVPQPDAAQKRCVRDLGGCPEGGRSGIPSCEEIAYYNQECRRRTGYEGPDVIADCKASGFVPECGPPRESKPAPKQEETPAPPQEAPRCDVPYKQAKTFQQLIDLVRGAEARLSKGGITSAKDQIHALRGVYYGTTWSLDYTGTATAPGEGSETRNEGFQRFTRPSQEPAQSVPRDIRPLLDCGLFDALKASQDVVEPSRHVDFGHLLIALDARYDPQLASQIQYPYALGLKKVPMGGTGTELVTWLGDLGGGAAKVALTRAGTAFAPVSVAFSAPSDYGGTINLEGDVAGFVVATSSTTAVTAPSIPSGKGLSDALQDYLSPATPGAAWKARSATFLSMYGGKLDPSGTLTNRTALADAFATKIQVFACNYLASRVNDKHISYTIAKSAAQYVIPASAEIAETFVDALVDANKSGGNIEAKRFPAPKPAQPGACAVQIVAGALLP